MRLNIHILYVVCNDFPTLFCIVVAHSSFFPSLKKMSRLRSSVSALIARQPALIAQAVTFSNLTRTQAFLPCVQWVPHGRYTARIARLFIRQQLNNSQPIFYHALLREKVTVGAVVSLQSRCVNGPSLPQNAVGSPCKHCNLKLVSLQGLSGTFQIFALE